MELTHEHAGDRVGVDGQTLVRVDDDAEQTRVRLNNRFCFRIFKSDTVVSDTHVDEHGRVARTQVVQDGGVVEERQVGPAHQLVFEFLLRVTVRDRLGLPASSFNQ